MSELKVGLAGIGKLGAALVKQWDMKKRAIGAYHSNSERARQFTEAYAYAYPLSKQELLRLDVLLLALPANNVARFLEEILEEAEGPVHTIFINMATSLFTPQLTHKFPDVRIAGVKFMGHSQDLWERGAGLFITEAALPRQLKEMFREIGEIKVDKEEVLQDVNKLASYYAVKAAFEIESALEEKGLPSEYKERALASLAPEMIRSYSQGKVGHFGQQVIQELKEDLKGKQHS